MYLHLLNTLKNLSIAVLITFLVSACSSGGTSSSPPSTQEVALLKITAYAEDGSQPVPTLQNYTDAGVSGVSSDNLIAFNTLVESLALTDVDTIDKLQALTTQLTTALPPSVDAGENQIVQIDKSITITGVASAVDGDIISYLWTRGPTVLSTTAKFIYTPATEGTDTLTLTVTDTNAATASASIKVKVVTHNVSTVWFATDGVPAGTFWYLGDNKWERETFYDCASFTETGRKNSTIFLTDTAGVETFEINLKENIITSDQSSYTHEILESSNREREQESYVVCPSTSNDHTPLMTSSASTKVNGGRTFVLKLEASDADLPPQELTFSLTENPDTDNNLFKITNYSEKSRSACRAGTQNQGNPEDPNNSKYFIIQDGVNSLEQCQDACNQYPFEDPSTLSCKGVEYRAENADSVDTEPRCELWTTTIEATAPQPSYDCYSRKSEKPSVLSFINTPDFAIPLDSDVNNVYEVEVKVSDGEDVSDAQTVSVTVVPNGDYIGKAGTACRAGLQNEGHPEDPYNSDYFTIINDVKSLEDCKALCDAHPLIDDPSVDCMGVEYRVKGADYADTASRCELWKVPVVATTPQKEYSCYQRELIIDDYGPRTESYVGNYKASGYINGSFVTKTMTLSQLSEDELKWTENGSSWTVTRTTNRNKLNVASDYPNTGDGYEESDVFWDAEEISGITGPSGLIYRTDWAHAKLSHSQSVYRKYINEHPSEIIRVTEAERQIRELKWAIAEKINTAAAYRAYKNDIDEAYGRTDEADRRIQGFKAFVTAEVLRIEVDESVPAIGEDNDLELFYNLEFTKADGRPRADEPGWSAGDLILESILQDNGAKITTINDGADRAYLPAGGAEKTLKANESQTLRYGGLMFEFDSLPEPSDAKSHCGEHDGGFCDSKYLDEDFFSADFPFAGGIFNKLWNDHRTWAGNASTAGESLQSSYYFIKLADLEYEVPKIETKTIKFASDEKIRVKYEFTKRTQAQYDENNTVNTLSCDEPALKKEKLQSRSSASIEPPGFIIRNETDHTFSVSLNQVGPLYYGEVPPGKIFKRDTAWGHFTIDAVLNMTGEQRYDNWDVAAPIAQFTAEVLLTVITGGSPISSIKSAINAVASKLVTTGASATARAGASAMARTAFGRATLRAGAAALKKAAQSNHQVLIKLVKSGGSTAIGQGIDTALNEAFTQKLIDEIYTKEATGVDRTWRYSGAWPETVQMYHIVGGPRLPCVTAKGNVQITSSKLQILNDAECKKRPDICTLH